MMLPVKHHLLTACPVEQAVSLWAAHFQQRQLVLAYSGGMDSAVLLHALYRLGYRPQLVHVHHGLQTVADDWVEFAQQQALNYGLALNVHHVQLSSQSRRGMEAKAREVRYKALWQSVMAGGVLLTAHHQRDQAETILLRLLRGSGVKGLGAMRAQRVYTEGRQHIRPLLSVPYVQLQAYAQHHQLLWVEDPTNEQTIALRNEVRLQLLPMLSKWQQQSDALLAQTAQHCQEADELLQQMAKEDWEKLAIDAHRFRLLNWQSMSWPRARQALAYALAQLQVTYSTAQWQQVKQQFYARTDKQTHPQLCTQGYCLLLADVQGYVIPQAWLSVASQQLWVTQTVSVCDWAAWLRLQLSASSEQSITLKPRQGGESVLVAGRRHSLKKWLQQQAVPHWQMMLWPVFYDQQGQVIGWFGLSEAHWQSLGLSVQLLSC